MEKLEEMKGSEEEDFTTFEDIFALDILVNLSVKSNSVTSLSLLDIAGR